MVLTTNVSDLPPSIIFFRAGPARYTFRGHTSHKLFFYARLFVDACFYAYFVFGAYRDLLNTNRQCKRDAVDAAVREIAEDREAFAEGRREALKRIGKTRQSDSSPPVLPPFDLMLPTKSPTGQDRERGTLYCCNSCSVK